MEEKQLRAFASTLEQDSYASEVLADALVGKLDASSLEIDSLFRALVLDEGCSVSQAGAVYFGLTSLIDRRGETLDEVG